MDMIRDIPRSIRSPVFIYGNPTQHAFSHHWVIPIRTPHAGCERRKGYHEVSRFLVSLSTPCSGINLGIPRRHSLGISLWGQDLLECRLGTSKRDSQARMVYMSLIPGKTLREAWPSLTIDDKNSLQVKLKEIVASLKPIQSPGIIGKFLLDSGMTLLTGNRIYQ